MTETQRPAGVAGTFFYELSEVPFDRPYMTIYSDAARTVVAVPRVQTAAIAGNASKFLASYPATLAAARYYLRTDTVLVAGQTAQVDSDDELVLYAVTGSVAGLAASVISVARYRTITGDTVTADAAVASALIDAERLVGEYLGRPIQEAQRTERMQMYRDGRVYPLVTPISSVVSPATGVTIEGAALLGAIADDVDLAWGIGWNSTAPPVATVTYVGGWRSDTIPATIEREIAWKAREFLHPVPLSSVPPGATKVAVGDASLSYDDGPGGAGELSQRARGALKRWRKRSAA